VARQGQVLLALHNTDGNCGLFQNALAGFKGWYCEVTAKTKIYDVLAKYVVAEHLASVIRNEQMSTER
jgi:hypothetical protein